MKAYLITVTFTDGEKEGVLFTREEDALDALNGVFTGSTLAVQWYENYGDSDCPIELKEIEI